MSELFVNLPGAGYSITVDRGLLSGVGEIVAGRRAIIITDANVAGHYLEALEDSLDGNVDSIILPAGEEYKSVESLQAIWEEMAEREFPRDGLLLALGGGVIGDITGMAAATWMRGVAFLQLPTSLLAMVDASVGGKTAVNLDAGKNLVGAFHQPEAVLADLDTLASLPQREFRSGLAEVVKAALLDGEDFIDWLEQNSGALLHRDPDTVREAILRSCRLKADIVAEDEREAGRRAVLNLGHTFGHAIETGLGHGEWLHGEAVAAGMVLALRYSSTQLGLDAGLPDRVARLLQAFELPVKPPPELDGSRMLALMGRDKKADSAGLRLVLLAAPGEPVLQRIEDEDGLLRLIETG